MHVVFVCAGNICRSAYAERLARLVAQSEGLRGLEFSSAGITALVGQGVEELMLAQLESRGGSGEGFASRQAGIPTLRDADVIITMERAHRAYVLEEVPAKVRQTFTMGQLARIIPTLDPSLRGADVVRAAAAAGMPARSGDSVADPYRRGPEAAETAAHEIEQHLRVILPALADA